MVTGRLDFSLFGCSWTSTGGPSKMSNSSFVLSKSFLQLSFKQCLSSPIRKRGLGDFEQQGSRLVSSLFKSCVSYAKWGKDMGEWQGGWEKGRNVLLIRSTGRKQAFQSCCRYLMKAQAATMARANNGTSTIGMGIPLGSPSPRCPIGPFCTCNWKGKRNVNSSDQCVFTTTEISGLTHYLGLQSLDYPKLQIQALPSRGCPLRLFLLDTSMSPICWKQSKSYGEASDFAVLLT